MSEGGQVRNGPGWGDVLVVVFLCLLIAYLVYFWVPVIFPEEIVTRASHHP